MLRTAILTFLVTALPGEALLAQGNRAVYQQPLVKKFDKDKNGRLEGEERKTALAWIRAEREKNPPRRRGGRPAPESKLEPRKISKGDVPTYPDKPLYDSGVIRTIFLEIENPNWDAEMQLYWRTGIREPAKLTVDGKTYEGVGVHYRGSSSFFTIMNRKKKSFGISMDWGDKKQRLMGYKSLNLLSGHADPSFLRTVLFAHIVGKHMPIAKACFVHLVINGESWGIYINDQQNNREFLEEAFGTRQGARWKIPPNFAGQAALHYQGPDKKDYETKYDLKAADSKKAAWQALIGLCETLTKSSPQELETKLPKILDIDHTLQFLALDNVLMDGDGYHYRGSDYAIYMHPSGKFYPLFRDSNEAFNYGGGPGGFGRNSNRRGPSQGARLDPLQHVNEERAALCKALFSVPKWREQYLKNCRAVLDNWLDWDKLAPLIAEFRAKIEPMIKVDDKALYGYEAFVEALDQGTERRPGLKKFVEERRAFLLKNEHMLRLAK